jgi:hypothetical protein
MKVTCQIASSCRVAMPKSEREETITALVIYILYLLDSRLLSVSRSPQTSRIFSAMLNDLIMDVTLQSHHEIARSRTVCNICHTWCVVLQLLLGAYTYTAFPQLQLR